MKTIPQIEAFAAELTEIRRDFHAHPELGFEEVRTSGRVADLLESWGIKVTRGIGKTGVIGVIKGARPGKTIGLRADMDALPMDEETNLPWSSRHPGVFHGCGHDGHTTMLLGAGRYLAENRDFAGTAVLIFQPAEEGRGGAVAMLKDGLFDQFPCDELYGLHNTPYQDFGVVKVRPGKAQAGAGMFDINIQGLGGHGAMPQIARDPIVIGAGIVKELQSIVARNIDPVHSVVISVTQFHAGSAYNVIPSTAHLAGTIRFFDRKDRELAEERIRKICAGFALANDVEIKVDIRFTFEVLSNDPQRVEDMLNSAKDIVGDLASPTADLTMGSEDMADLLNVVPGAYFNLGHKGTVPLHHPGFIFDDDILPVGSSLLAHLVETRGAAVD